MSTIAEIEASLPSLSADELARVESALNRLQRERSLEARFDGRPWPTTPEERDALLAQLDLLPPLLTSEEADRFEVWRAAEKERQRALSTRRSPIVGQLFT